MQNSNRRSSWMFSLSVLIGSAACVLATGCTRDEWIAELPMGLRKASRAPTARAPTPLRFQTREEAWRTVKPQMLPPKGTRPETPQ